MYMPKFVQDLIAVFCILLPLVLNNERDGVPGPDKKKKATEDMKAFLNKPESPVKFPPILLPYQDLLIGLMIDVLINILNSNGFFKSSSGSSK